MRRGLCEVLLRIEIKKRQYTFPIEIKGEIFRLFFLFLVVDTQISVEEQPGCGSCKNIAVRRRDLYLHVLITGRAHSAGQKALPDQVVQPELVS